MQSNVQKAVLAYLGLANDFMTSIGSRFYFSDAPESETFPYATGEFTLDTPSRDSCTKDETFRLVFNAYQLRGDGEDVVYIGEKLIAYFDDCEASLSVSGYHVTFVDRQFNFEVPQPNQRYNQYTAAYDIKIEEVN
jgi:hypothetical protein